MANKFFIGILTLLTFVSHGLCGTRAVEKSVPQDIYLCIGQSNMAGRGLLSNELMDTLQNVSLLNGDGVFEPAVNPLNRYSTIRKDLKMQRLSLVYSFAKEMVRLRGCSVGLIVNARGGSSINLWLKGATNGYYDQALQRVRKALQNGGTLRAVIWHQGEADCAYSERYRAQIKQLIADLRADLNMPELPFVFGEIAHWNFTGRAEGTEPFNAMLGSVASQINNCACVSSEGLGQLKDVNDPHFSAQGQILFGQRYAQAVIKLLK